MDKVAVLGGTGKAGKFVVNALIRQGIPFKMLVRSPDKIRQKNPLMEIDMGSARNYASIQRLLTGCQVVISLLGPSKAETDTCSVAVSHVITVMQKIGIKRYVEVAGLGIETPEDNKSFRTRMIVKVIKTFYPAVIHDRQKGYQILAGSNIDWTIVRCPMIELTDSKRLLKVDLRDSPGIKVSAADLADFLVRQITDDQYIKKCPFVAS